MLATTMQAAVAATSHSVWTIVDSVTKIAIALIGGAWALLTYYRGRTFRRRLELKLSGKVMLHNGAHLASLDAGVKNVGLSRANIIQQGTWLRIVILGAKPDSDSVALPNQKHLGTSPVFKDHSWVEPGEEIHDVMLVQLPMLAREDIALQVNLRIVSEEMHFRRLAQISAEDLVEADDLAKMMKQRLAWSAGTIIPLHAESAADNSTECKEIR
jgi:hypothetical protein